MHRATSIEALAHILQTANLAALFAASALRSSVTSALESLAAAAGSTRRVHVVWFDDGSDPCGDSSDGTWDPKRALSIIRQADPSGRVGVSTRVGLGTACLTHERTFIEHTFIELVSRGSACSRTARERVAVVTPETVVKLLPSSGSTGLPKLVVVTDGALFKVGSGGRRAPGAAVRH